MAEPSLIPYLSDAGTLFHLALEPCVQDVPPGDEPHFPFALAADSGAVTRLVKARVMTGAGSPLKEVFLLVSRDEYRVAPSGMSPLTNKDLDLAWQGAYENHRRNGSVMALSSQDDGRGGILPFGSLFYCRKTSRFFRPLCPRCAGELVLCRDDAALEEAGLKAYSTSLARYLVCPSCRTPDGKRTYFSSSPGATDPLAVKGPHDLIRAFGNLSASELPCTGCADHDTCYREDNVLSVIVPVAFYPFHLLMFEAASLNAEDYLALVSGAPGTGLVQALSSEREYGRRSLLAGFLEKAAPELLFTGTRREFLEVLYLKLSFLGEVARCILADTSRFAYPQVGPSVSGLWVSVPDQSSLLPALWTFRLALADMEPSLPEMLPPAHPDYAAWCMGLLWFHVLPGGKGMDAAALNEGTARIIAGDSPDGIPGMSGPRDIFWQEKPVPEEWGHLWERALALGRTLLVGGGDMTDFSEGLAALRADVGKELFAEGSPAQASAAPPAEEASGDARIGAILTRIRSTWSRERIDAVPDAAPPVPPLTAGAAPEDADATIAMRPSAQESRDDELSRTVVAAPAGAVQAGAPAVDDDFSTETIIMQHRQTPAPKKEPEALDQTVLMGAAASPEAPGETATETAKPAPDDLDATVVMGAKARPPQEPPPKRPEPAAPDALEETVIIKPDKKR